MKRNNYLVLTNDGIIEAYGFEKAEKTFSAQVMELGIYLLPDRQSESLIAVDALLESTKVKEKRIVRNKKLYDLLRAYGYKKVDFIYSEEADSYISI